MMPNGGEVFPISVNSDFCGHCWVCTSVCPFDALEADEETKSAVLDTEKCAVCGICPSVCPAGAISALYYDQYSVTAYLRAMKEVPKTLVLTCRGSTPTQEELERMIGVSEFERMTFPCVGRIPTEFFMQATQDGVERMFVISCDDYFCRFEEGSKVTMRKAILAKRLLGMMGYDPGAITVLKSVLVAEVDRDACVGCGNCFAVCPFDAVTMESPGISHIDPKKCKGCGICLPLCTGMAIELKNSEFEPISTAIALFSSSGAKPSILVFKCKWNELGAFDGSPEQLTQNITTVELPCSGRLDPLHVIEAFGKGIDGVLVVSCQEDECRLEEGSKEAEKRISILKSVLEEVGINPERLEFLSVSSKKHTFRGALEDFALKMEDMEKPIVYPE